MHRLSAPRYERNTRRIVAGEKAETDHRATRVVYLHLPRPYKVTRVHYMTLLHAMLSSRIYLVTRSSRFLSLVEDRIVRVLYLPVQSLLALISLRIIAA